MATNQMVQQIGLEYTKDAQDIPKFGPGDTVRLSLKVVEVLASVSRCTRA